MPELRLDGAGTVEAIEACPEIASGEGHVVTGRLVTRRCNDLVKGVLSNGESLTGTSPHPVWSRTRQDWGA